MKWSLKIARILGIDVFLHWTFIVLIGGVFIAGLRSLINGSGDLQGFWFIFLLFIFVLLHELGHALMGRKFGVKTNHITLLPIGGVASMEHIPEKPMQELQIALAGPFVNLCLAVFFLLILTISGNLPPWSGLFSPGANDELAYSLFSANFLLFTFNLIPAFPMDGGRVLRAVLAMKFDRYKATNIAVRIGQLLAIGLIGISFFTSFWWMFIGLFIYLGAGAESNYEVARSTLSKYKVNDATMHHFHVLKTIDTINDALKMLLDGQEKEFLVAENEEVVGTLSRDELLAGLSRYGNEATLEEVYNPNVVNFDAHMPLDEAFDKLNDAETDLGPVLDQGKLIGVLSRENITEILVIENSIPKKKSWI
jgi:Zn-dependent protease/CBS domain-containing protein